MEVKRLKYPVGRQDFASLREDGCVYVDKTENIFNLVQDNKYVFLSRPRRFGKSLLLSTIRYYFEGRKDLFEGLKIMDLEKDWKRHPVLHLELGSIDCSNEIGLSAEINRQLKHWESEYGVTEISESLSSRFRNVIISARKQSGQRVVILIDEYDNPLINSIHNREIYDINRNLLKSVYSNLKGMDEYIRFAMLTGVSRFSNTTVFSGLNNLQDITFNVQYSDICGFTRDEIEQYLWTGVRDLAQAEGCLPKEALELLKKEYDGYHFSERLIDIYNPFSLLNCLHNQKIDNYWIQSGLPTFLARKLDKSSSPFSSIFNSKEDSISLSTVDAAFDSPVALLYQTGYLTIKSYDRELKEYRLGIPNREVDHGLFRFLLGHYSMTSPGDASKNLREMARMLQKGEPDKFMETLQVVMSPISYHLQGKMTETDFERTLFVIFHVLGFHVHSQLATSRGRIDLTVETKDYVYVMELKLDKSAEKALEQIEEKDYSLPWRHDGRKVFKIGISFSSEKRNIGSWIIA